MIFRPDRLLLAKATNTNECRKTDLTTGRLIQPKRAESTHAPTLLRCKILPCRQRQAIDHSRDTTLERFLFALGIEHVGESTAKALALVADGIRAFEIGRASCRERVSSPV